MSGTLKAGLAILLISVTLTCVFFLFKPKKEKDIIQKYTIHLKYGGTLFIRERLGADFPQQLYDHYIYNEHNKFITRIYYKKQDSTPYVSFDCVYHDAQAAYYIDRREKELIWRTSKGQYFALFLTFDLETSPVEYPELLPVARILSQKNWVGLEVWANYLLKSHDKGTKELLKRYARGKFTKKEIELNRDGVIVPNEIREYAQEKLRLLYNTSSVRK